MNISENPIGIFDSGIGGLTVARQILHNLPNENIIYLGDTEHLPYGSKSEDAVKYFSLRNAEYLIEQDAKIVVIACNTASAVAAEYVKHNTSVPVIGVVQSGAESAARTTSNGIIGVIGTKATVRSGAYTKAIRQINPELKVMEAATPLLVHLVEENWIEHKVTVDILEEYLMPLLNTGIDTLVLGCTHYPFIKQQIKHIAPSLMLIDSAIATGAAVRNLLQKEKLISESAETADIDIRLTDIYADTAMLAGRFLDRHVEPMLINL